MGTSESHAAASAEVRAALPADYAGLLDDIKQRIATARVKAAAVNQGFKSHRSGSTWLENPRETNGDNRWEMRSSGSCSR
jgi:hypothetical protein